MESATSIVVSIATIGSPEGCESTVRHVLAQELPAHQHVSLLVVDNNPVPAGIHVPDGVTVLHEPTPGIAPARNAAIRAALESGADVLVFIDDDEVPGSAIWLTKLVTGLDALSADITTGPVVSSFDPAAPRWIREHPVFHRRRYPTGRSLTRAASNNIAFRTSALRGHDRMFDPRFALVGGSDTDLTRRLVHAGCVIRWVDEADVLEYVPRHRTTVRWVLRRSWRLGSNRAQRRRWGTPGEPARLSVIAGSLAELVVGSALALTLVLPSRRLALVALGRAARGAGALAAEFGMDYREYEARATS